MIAARKREQRGPLCRRHGGLDVELLVGAEDGFFELKGVNTAIYIGNPHATIDVEAEGESWRVELAPPSRTMAAGFTEDVAKVGDEVTAIGNRSQDETEHRMKAVRVIVNGGTYDVYPDRAPPA